MLGCAATGARSSTSHAASTEHDVAVSEPVSVVSPVVELKAASLGAAGQQWLAALPGVIGELERRWSVSVEHALGGGTAAYVARAVTSSGRPVVMKIGVPDPDFADEIGTLARARGHGYVHLLAYDIDRRAMLLEALGPSLDRTGMSPESQISVLCGLLAQAWTLPPASESPTAAQDKASGLARLVRRLWGEFGVPCSERVVARALLFADRRAAAFDAGRCVPVHGDAAPTNALKVLEPRPGAETGYVFVDPDGFVGDPAYDLGVALRDWSPQLLASDDAAALARHYCHLLAEGSGVDEQQIWEWGYLERVSTGLYARAMGANELAQPFFDTAVRLL
jgi:streptomycin 6-kinase